MTKAGADPGPELLREVYLVGLTSYERAGDWRNFLSLLKDMRGGGQARESKPVAAPRSDPRESMYGAPGSDARKSEPGGGEYEARESVYGPPGYEARESVYGAPGSDAAGGLGREAMLVGGREFAAPPPPPPSLPASPLTMTIVETRMMVAVDARLSKTCNRAVTLAVKERRWEQVGWRIDVRRERWMDVCMYVCMYVCMFRRLLCMTPWDRWAYLRMRWRVMPL